MLPQLFADRLDPHPHVHALVTEGAFDDEGRFHSLKFDPQLEREALNRLFARKVMNALVKDKKLSEEFRDEILEWDYTGFSVDTSVRINKGEYSRLRRLVRYMARPAISLERVTYDATTGRVNVLSTKKFDGRRTVVAGYDALTFLALLSLQVPLKGTHMVRYFGALNQGTPDAIRPKGAFCHSRISVQK